jgi:hypothetical protein
LPGRVHFLGRFRWPGRTHWTGRLDVFGRGHRSGQTAARGPALGGGHQPRGYPVPFHPGPDGEFTDMGVDLAGEMSALADSRRRFAPPDAAACPAKVLFRTSSAGRTEPQASGQAVARDTPRRRQRPRRTPPGTGNPPHRRVPRAAGGYPAPQAGTPRRRRTAWYPGHSPG